MVDELPPTQPCEFNLKNELVMNSCSWTSGAIAAPCYAGQRRTQLYELISVATPDHQ